MDEVTQQTATISKRVMYSLGIALILSVVVFFFSFVDDEQMELKFSVIAAGVTFVVIFLIMYFLLSFSKIEQIKEVEGNENYKTLAELTYKLKDVSKWYSVFLIVISVLFLMDLISFFMEEIPDLLREEAYSEIIVYVIMPFVAIAFMWIVPNIKVTCRLTDLGIVSGFRKNKVLQRWDDIESYELKKGVILIRKSSMGIPMRFPVLDQQDKVVQILDKYIKNNKNVI